MGRKQTGAWKQIHFFVAILISLIIAGCAFVPPSVPKNGPGVKEDDSARRLAAGRKFFGEGDFVGALRELEKVSSPCARPDVDQEVLLLSGLIWMDPTNPRRDYGKSATFFRRLIESSPKSPFAGQARILVTIMRENDESTRTIEKLKALIEASKKVDIGIDEKKRDKAR